MPDVVVTATVGFVSAVLGAVAGHAGALHIDGIRETRRRRATIKGLVHEMYLNIEAIHTVIANPNEMLPLSDVYWSDVRTVAPLYLDDDTYDCLASGYSLMPRFRQTLERYREREDQKDMKELLKYADETLKAASSMLEAQMTADTPFWTRAWRRVKQPRLTNINLKR